MSKVIATPTPSARLISLLAQAYTLAEVRLGAIRFLASAPNSATLAAPIADLIDNLCLWVVNRSDFSLLHGLLGLPIAVKSLSRVLAVPRCWQAALLFLLSQDKITINSQPDLFHAMFSQSDLVRSVLPNLVLRCLSDSVSGTRQILRLQAVLHWASSNPPQSPYLGCPEFPLSLLAVADLTNVAVIGLASSLGNARAGVKAADFQLDAVRLLNHRAIEGTISGDVSMAIQVLLSQNATSNEISYPLHGETILNILSLSLVHHLLQSNSALAILECAITRSLSQSIATLFSAEDSRSVCEAIMQLSIVAETELTVLSSLYWKSIMLLMLLSSICPGSIGVFAHKRIANISGILNAIVTNHWESIPTIPNADMPERFPLDLSTSQPIPDSILASLRQLAASYALADRIIGNDSQFQLVTLLSSSQTPQVLCDWLLPVLNETVSRRENVPVIVLSHLLLFLGAQSPPYCLDRIRACCASYAGPDQSPAAAAVILQLLNNLSNDDYDVRQRARTALQIALDCNPDEPFSFLKRSAVADLGLQAIRAAIQAESNPAAVTHYVRFLIDHARRCSALNDQLIEFLYDNVLLRWHIARAMLPEHGATSGLHDVVEIIVSKVSSTSTLSGLLFDFLVITASHGGIPPTSKDSVRRLIAPERISDDHVSRLFEGCPDEDLQKMAIEKASADQVRLFAKGFGRSPTLLDACQSRLQALGVSGDDSGEVTMDNSGCSVPMQDEDVAASEQAAMFVPVDAQLNGIAERPAPFEVKHIGLTPPPEVPRRRFDLNISSLEVVTPRFHPNFHTIKHNKVGKLTELSPSDKERLFGLWSSEQYEELITEVRELCPPPSDDT